MRQNKVLQFSAPGLETPSIPLKNPDGVKEGKRKQEVASSQEHKAVVRVQWENFKVGGKRIRGLKARMGCEGYITRRGPDGPD